MCGEEDDRNHCMERKSEDRCAEMGKGSCEEKKIRETIVHSRRVKLTVRLKKGDDHLPRGRVKSTVWRGEKTPMLTRTAKTAVRRRVKTCRKPLWRRGWRKHRWVE